MSGQTIVFFPEGAFGPTNNCVGIGAVLRERGHRVVFVIEESFAGTLEEKGFEERLMRLAPPPEQEEAPGQFWKDFIRDTAPVFRKSTFDQLGEFIAPTWQALVDGARYVNDRLTEILEEVAPDAVVEDNVCAFPAIPASGRPWVRIVSCNPLELEDPELPPSFSGLALDDRSRWADFRAEYRRVIAKLQSEFSDFCESRGAPPLPEGELIHTSPWLNLYLYPRELDYPRSRPLGPTWHNLESSVRTTDPSWSIPDELADRDGALIYVSLGSLGSGDVPLMRSLVEALSKTRHRYVVSKGPQHDQYQLADNMAGEEFLPQASLLPHVDLVITHGGNNTVTECLHFGKPMVALPVFWDQHDNAQRIHETGFGVRLPTYSFDDGDLAAAIDRLLENSHLGCPPGGRVRAASGDTGQRPRRRPDRAAGLGGQAGDGRRHGILTPMSNPPKLLEDLLGAPGPSGYEGPAADVWRKAAAFAELSTDALGSSVAQIGESGAKPLVAVVGHIDEIGLVVTHVDEKGFLYFAPIGGWDPQILLGQRVSVQGKDGPVTGVIGRKPIHLLKDDQRKQVVELRDMHMDIGAASGDDALARVRIGDPAVIAADPVSLDAGRLVSRSLDDRIGAYVALEALRRVHERGGLKGRMAAMAAVQEEIGSHGARTATFSLEPDLAIAIDVTHATDAPGVEEKELGHHPLGSGAVIARGATLSPRIYELLVETAERLEIPYTVEASGSRTATDADVIQIARDGTPAGLVSIPLRYMHSPVELADLADVDAAVELVAGFALALGPELDLVR